MFASLEPLTFLQARTKLSNVSNVATFPNDQPMLKSTQLNQAKQCIVALCQQCTAVANHNVRHNVRPMRSMQQPTSRPGICQHFKFQHTLALKANDQELWSGAPLPMWIAHTGSPSTFSWCPQHLRSGLFLRHCLNEIGVLAKQPSVSSRYGSTASRRALTLTTQRTRARKGFGKGSAMAELSTC